MFGSAGGSFHLLGFPIYVDITWIVILVLVQRLPDQLLRGGGPWSIDV